MARKTRARSRHKARRGRSSHLSAAGAITRTGWGRFAFGILIGLALGVGGALYLGGFELGNKGGAKVTTLNASPVQKATQKTAEAPAKAKPAPQVVEPPPPPAHTKPLGEEAKIAAQAGTKPPSPVPPAQVATIAPPPPIDAGAGAAWLKNSVAFSAPPGKPLIAVVLDDVGVARGHAELAIDLPGVITLSFMTYADGVADMAARARAKGHELMLHVPMEPLGHEIDAGPHVLTVDAPEGELLKRLAWGLERFPGYVGINNHMGSRFTQDERGMGVVLAELKRRNLLFLDSRTIGNTVGDKLAARMGVAHVMRDVFLDNEMDEAAVVKQLMQAERIAASKGQAIAIGHPHPATIAAIRAWMPKAEARGFVIVPLSAVAKLRLGASG
ncbi:MAG TPA: divergent polysaccharide deacetylase family protein [Dongiaceae bacterium]|nr:divergent polysaccharide deacetylase family protein [Dongiaceae bacterium]